jgi:Protein of unknown function (DUF2568)
MSLSLTARSLREVCMRDRKVGTRAASKSSEQGLAPNINLALRFLLELCGLAAFAYWGFKSGSGAGARLVLTIGAPLCMAIVWGIFVAPRATVKLAEPVRFVLGLAILCLSAVALASAGQRTLAVAFAAIVVINAVLLAVWKQ